MIDIDPKTLASDHAIAYLTERLRTIADFPKPGIQFKDITPLLGEPRALQITLDLLAQPFIDTGVDKVVAIEARGFIFGGALAARLGCGFVPIRKPGKLPADVDKVSYALEYGEGKLEVHRGSLREGERVLIVDDLLATGGTAAATIELVERQGGQVAAFAFVVELDFLAGRDKLLQLTSAATPVHALIHISGD